MRIKHTPAAVPHNGAVGFVLWMESDLAWAAGTYEYRAMGAAVISNTDLFRPGDFRRDCQALSASSPSYIGHFASICHVNGFLLNQRRIRAKYIIRRQSPHPDTA
jgi:hypothetical protein